MIQLVDLICAWTLLDPALIQSKSCFGFDRSVCGSALKATLDCVFFPLFSTVCFHHFSSLLFQKGGRPEGLREPSMGHQSQSVLINTSTPGEHETDQTECVSKLLKACLLISPQISSYSAFTSPPNTSLPPASPRLLAFLHHRPAEVWILIGWEMLMHFLFM